MTLPDADEDSTVFFSPNVPLKDLINPEKIANSESMKSSSDEYTFFDEATIVVRAGSGGQGANTHIRNQKRQQLGGDGGNGGKGGNVILLCDRNINTLARLSLAHRPNLYGGSGAARSTAKSQSIPHFRAENGADGAGGNRNGRYGQDTIVRVPPGTIVEEIHQLVTDTQNTTETTTKLVKIGRLSQDGKTMIVAKGGQGGEGTGVLQKGIKRPRQAATGGEHKRLKLSMQLIADVAIVGVPNAGKSTLLASVTKAKPKISNYPFTTIIPNLGVYVPPNTEDDSALVLCDVPGLVPGASAGVGLGHAFLRHVERCHVLLHLVDATSDDPIADYEMLNREILSYGTGQLAKLPQVVAVNKADAMSEGGGRINWEEGLRTKFSREELEQKLKETLPHSRLMWISAREQEGVDDLMTRLLQFVGKVKEAAMVTSSPSE